ncbi:MAG TPA: MlaD family protein [Bryobacteraceae bacterium]|nr:MlaD family protein [Bryobacteraceae bacterium]
MPTPEEVAWAKFRVGAMIGCAMGILAVLIYLLMGGADAFQPSASVYAYLKDLGGVQKNSAVQFNGIHVGEVSKVALSGLKDPNKAVRIDLAIENRYLNAIPLDSTVEVTAENVLDDQFVNIIEGKNPQHLTSGAELRPAPTPAINPAEILQGGRQILAQLDAVVRDMETGHGNVGQLVRGDEIYNSMLSKVSEFQRAIHAAVNKDTLSGRLIFDETYYDKLEAPAKRLDHALADWQAGQGSTGKLLKDPAQYEQLRKSVGNLNRALADLNAGKGSGGKLLKDDELYRRINRIVDDLNAQIDAFNSGEGALGQFMANTSMYETLQGSTKNLQDMLHALREDPKKFLRPKLF